MAIKRKSPGAVAAASEAQIEKKTSKSSFPKINMRVQILQLNLGSEAMAVYTGGILFDAIGRAA